MNRAVVVLLLLIANAIVHSSKVDRPEERVRETNVAQASSVQPAPRELETCVRL